MAKVLVNFRVDEAELERYKLAAGALGMSLSDWVRSRLEPAQTTAANGEIVPADAGVTSRVSEGPAVSLAVGGLEAPGTPSPPKAPVYASERPRAKRSVLCPHRRRPDEFCPRCD